MLKENWAGEERQAVDTATGPSAIDLAVRTELIRVLYGRATVPLINVVVAVISAGLLRGLYPVWVTVAWVSVTVVVTGFRLALWLRFSRSRPGAIEPWGLAFTLSTSLMGCLWGLLASIVFVTNDPVYHLFAAFVLGGMCAGAAMRNSPHLPAYYCFAIPAALPMIVGLLTRDRAMSVGMGALLLIFVVVLTIVARENNVRFTEYIRIKIEQDVLNDDLKRLTLDLTKQVDERRKTALALEESSERFHAIGDNALDAIIISDSNGEVVFWNPAAERIFGYKTDEIIGSNIHKILSPVRFREKAIERFAHFVNTGQGDVLGKTVLLGALRKDGTEFPIDLSVSSMNLGGTRHALGILRDVSDREKAMRVLEERGAELKEAQRLAHIGNWSYDPRNGTTVWSEELFRIFGRESSLPAPSAVEYTTLITLDSVAKMTAAMQRCVDNGESFDIDLELLRADVQTSWVSMRGEVRRTGDGEVHLRGTAQDITIRKRVEELARDQESMFRSLVEQNMSGILIVSEEATITYLNPAAVEMLGFRQAQSVIGHPAVEFISDKDTSAVEAAMQSLIEGREKFAELAVTIRRANNEGLEVLAKSAIATFQGKRVIITVVMDITERRRSEEKVVKLNEQMTTALAVLRRHQHDQTAIAKLSDMLQSCRSTAEAYPIIAATANLLFPSGTNGALALMEATAAQDLTRVAAWGADQEATLPGFLREDCWALRTGQCYEVDGPGNAAQCHHFSKVQSAPYLCLPLMVQGKTQGLLHLALAKGGAIDSELRQVMNSFGDVVKLSLANLDLRESLAEQALRDPLTGLFNRRYLVETLTREVRRAQRTGSSLTIAMMDIDHFKRFNDTEGHDAGDLILSGLGAFLLGNLRAGDIACRYGGEEFLTVLPECDLTTARERMTKFSALVKGKAQAFRGHTLPSVTLSIGLANLSNAISTGESLITAADEAMYAAKNNGRDRIEIFQMPVPKGTL
jgi:diguanylate cyclase (GGDEF)-like protein/PAS domain S-box-containing protein